MVNWISGKGILSKSVKLKLEDVTMANLTQKIMIAKPT